MRALPTSSPCSLTLSLPHRHQDDAQVLKEACAALWNLAANKDNHMPLIAAEAHVHIIRAIDRHEDNAQVQENACGDRMIVGGYRVHLT